MSRDNCLNRLYIAYCIVSRKEKKPGKNRLTKQSAQQQKPKTICKISFRMTIAVLRVLSCRWGEATEALNKRARKCSGTWPRWGGWKVPRRRGVISCPSPSTGHQYVSSYLFKCTFNICTWAGTGTSIQSDGRPGRGPFDRLQNPTTTWPCWDGPFSITVIKMRVHFNYKFQNGKDEHRAEVDKSAHRFRSFPRGNGQGNGNGNGRESPLSTIHCPLSLSSSWQALDRLDRLDGRCIMRQWPLFRA